MVWSTFGSMRSSARNDVTDLHWREKEGCGSVSSVSSGKKWEVLSTFVQDGGCCAVDGCVERDGAREAEFIGARRGENAGACS